MTCVEKRGDGWWRRCSEDGGKKRGSKKTLVISPAVCVNRADVPPLALSFCVRLSASLILLTKHAVP